MTPDTVPTDAAIRLALQDVLDPELGESIVDLGLVQRIEIEPGRVHVVLIPTSATCPMSAVLIEDATDAVRDACPAGTAVEVDIDWSTPWEPHRLSPELKDRFGW
ncbi:MAG: metal-sulfur cluster assembly factor [Rhizobacter sp.]|jgi:metal-sulfur cluster biosynthetic enzyme